MRDASICLSNGMYREGKNRVESEVRRINSSALAMLSLKCLVESQGDMPGRHLNT